VRELQRQHRRAVLEGEDVERAGGTVGVQHHDHPEHLVPGLRKRQQAVTIPERVALPPGPQQQLVAVPRPRLRDLIAGVPQKEAA
jgi:hypothetical protein